MTGVCRICGHTFSNYNNNETVCPKCRYEENWDRLCNYTTSDTPLTIEDSVTPYTPLGVDMSDTPYTPPTIAHIPSVSFDNIRTAAPALTVGSTVKLPVELIIKAKKIVLENGGIQLVVDNDTIKSIDSIEVNGIRFVKEGN